MILKDEYYAATKEHLEQLSLTNKVASGLSVGFVMEKKGMAYLTKDKLVLDGFAEIELNQIISTEVCFDSVYRRHFASGLGSGASGGPIRIGGITGGEPLIITYKTVGQTKTIYILIGWKFFSGRTKNKQWLEVLGKNRNDRSS